MFIPIVPIAHVFSFIFCLLLAIKFYVSFVKNPQSIYISSFFYATFFVSLMFLLIAMPGLIIRDPFLVPWVVYLFSEPAALFAVMFFAKIPMHLFGWKTVYKVYFYSMITISLAVIALRYLGMEETSVVRQGNFEFWLRPDNELYMHAETLSGITILLTLLFTLGSYIYLAVQKRKNKFVFQRSLVLALATMTFLLAIVANYFVGLHLALRILLSSGLCLISLVCMMAAVFYIKPKPS